MEFGTSSIAQPAFVGTASDFTMSEYYDAPHETQMKSLMTGDKAQPQPGGRFLIKGLRLELFRENGQKDVTVEAPECVYDGSRREASSSGPLKVRSGDGQLMTQGRGFLWRQDAGTVTISNDVETLIRTETRTAK